MYTFSAFVTKKFPKGLLLFGLLLLFSSCDNYPKDTYGSLEEAKNGVLLVGYIENPPFVIEKEGVLLGIEVEIVKDFARSIGTEIQWIHKNEQTLLQDLEKRNLHLVISGLDQKSPWTQHVGIVKSYVELNSESHTIAVPPGEHALVFQLEKFLKDHEGEIKEIINRYTEENNE